MSGGPVRIPFPPGFPKVVIQQPFNPAARPTQHPHYAAAKAWDKDAAVRFIMAMVVPEKLDEIRGILGRQKPIVVASHANEAQGRNAIPETYARYVADMLSLSADRKIVQSNRPQRTGRDGAYRLAARAEFDGSIETGRAYLACRRQCHSGRYAGGSSII